MSAELYEGHVVHVTLAGTASGRVVLSRLLEDSAHVTAFDIDEDGRLTAFLVPGEGELAFVRAMLAAGMYPLETMYHETPGIGGPRAC